MAPLQPVSDTDSAVPQCGPSGLKPATRWHLADPQPGPSSLEPTTLQDQTDPPPRLSSITPMNCDEKPSDPEPTEGGSTVILILSCFSHLCLVTLLSMFIYLIFTVSWNVYSLYLASKCDF